MVVAGIPQVGLSAIMMSLASVAVGVSFAVGDLLVGSSGGRSVDACHEEPLVQVV